MANNIPSSITRHPWGNAQVDKMGAVGVTAEEMKVRTGAGLPAPEVGPIAQSGPMEFINPSRSSDNLRLAVPSTENPFTTPTGPQHDYILVASAINRSRSNRSAELVKMLQDPPAGFKEEVVTQMRASLARENNMMQLLDQVQDMQQEVYGRILGSQEG
jgi:hypothetical protein